MWPRLPPKMPTRLTHHCTLESWDLIGKGITNHRRPLSDWGLCYRSRWVIFFFKVTQIPEGTLTFSLPIPAVELGQKAPSGISRGTDLPCSTSSPLLQTCPFWIYPKDARIFSNIHKLISDMPHQQTEEQKPYHHLNR